MDGDASKADRDPEIVRLENALARKTRELNAVRAFTGKVNSTGKLAELPEIVLEALKTELGFENSMLLLATAGTDQLVVIASKGYSDDGIGAVVQLGIGPIGVAARRRKVFFSNALRAAGRYVLHTATEMAGQREGQTGETKLPGLTDAQSLLVIPLTTAAIADRPEKLIGAVTVESRKTFAFSENDRQLVETIANIAATALENAMLNDEMASLLEAYERFVPKEFLHHLGKPSITDVRLGDHVQANMSVMFTDIRSFTALSEQMGSEKTFDFLNDYLAQIAPIIRENRGFIDKYIGDGIMAVFPETADTAVRAGISMQQSLAAFNETRLKEGEPPIQVGVGIHTGELMLGILGFEARMDGTVISDTVNLASRVESLSQRYGAPLIITNHTHAALEAPRAFNVRFIDRVRVKGKSDHVTLYEVLDALAPDAFAARKSNTATFAAGIEAYYARRFVDAERFLKRVTERDKDDVVAKIFMARASTLALSGTCTEWTGIETLEEK